MITELNEQAMNLLVDVVVGKINEISSKYIHVPMTEDIKYELDSEFDQMNNQLKYLGLPELGIKVELTMNTGHAGFEFASIDGIPFKEWDQRFTFSDKLRAIAKR